MKTTPAALISSLQNEVLTTATVWEITRTDGVKLYFTDADIDLTISGKTYKAAGGYKASNIQSDSKLSVDNLEVVGFLDNDSLMEIDLTNGVYDHANVKIGLVDWKNPSNGILYQKEGTFGVVSLNTGRTYQVELRGITQALQQQFGTVLLPTCDADFTDSRCKLNKDNFKAVGTVTTVVSGLVVQDSGRSEAQDYWKYGKFKITSGTNAGRFVEIESSNGGTINLMFAFPYQVSIGDTYEIYRGCGKTRDNCKAYNNIINFRGFPDVPGNNAILQGV